MWLVTAGFQVPNAATVSWAPIASVTSVLPSGPSSRGERGLPRPDGFRKEFGMNFSSVLWCESAGPWGLVTCWLVRILEMEPGVRATLEKQQNQPAQAGLTFKTPVTFCS